MLFQQRFNVLLLKCSSCRLYTLKTATKVDGTITNSLSKKIVFLQSFIWWQEVSYGN